MKLIISSIIGGFTLIAALGAAAPVFRESGVETESGQIEVVVLTEGLMSKASEGDEGLGRLLDAAHATIGVPYKWGGTQLKKGIDCSNYTWQLFRTVGLPYKRFLSTMVLSRLKQANGLRSVSFKEARAGDLLVYGYKDSSKRWHGHVVILIDRDGQTTGHQGLVLGAHGKPVSSVQFITFSGFEEGYFKNPQMRLCNVLRAVK